MVLTTPKLDVMGHDMKLKTTVNPNVRCLNCGKKWHTKNKRLPRFCRFCHSTNLEKFDEFRELKKQIKGINQQSFPYRKNWGKTPKSVKVATEMPDTETKGNDLK
jgi:hypothetical protein